MFIKILKWWEEKKPKIRRKKNQTYLVQKEKQQTLTTHCHIVYLCHLLSKPVYSVCDQQDSAVFPDRFNISTEGCVDYYGLAGVKL